MKANEFKKWWCDWIGSDKLPENTDIIYAFEAGQQSQQAKIDLLEKEIVETQAFLNNQNHIKQTKIDELQARIDEVMKYVSESPLKDVSRRAMINFMDILKGNKDEN